MTDIDTSTAAVDRLAYMLRPLHPKVQHIILGNDTCNTIAATLRALSARVAELDGAIDSIETSHGLTDNGNLWRFWSKEACDLARKLDDARTRAKRAEAALAKAERDCRSYQTMAEDAIHRMDRAVADRPAWEAETKKAQTEAVEQMQRAVAAEAALDKARDGLECARAIMDTPVARRRLGLEADDERLIIFRAALKGGDA